MFQYYVLLFSSRHNHILKVNFFLLFSNHGVKHSFEHPWMLSLASLCSIITVLHLHNTVLHKSAAPYVTSCKEITMGLNLDLSQRFSGELPHKKKYCSSRYLNLCLEVPPLQGQILWEWKQKPPNSITIFFFPSFEEFVLFSLL